MGLARRHPGKLRPSYSALVENGELGRRVGLLEKSLEACTLCPRKCRVDRRSGRPGACGVDARPKVAAVSIHPWEEPPISGERGSGTIFLSGCTLQCVFCQNYPISQMGVGRVLSVSALAQAMLKLQAQGALNINWVTPTHQVPALLHALLLAAERGLRLPIVYNTSGYERVETLRMLEGVVDIYLPDIKYADEGVARRCSQCSDYVAFNRAALREMWRQTGPVRVDEDGIAYRGTLVRHLLLPENLSGTSDCLAFLVRELGPDVWVSLMYQYFPAHRAFQSPPLDRKVCREEYEAAFQTLTRLGIHNGFIQSSGENEIPPEDWPDNLLEDEKRF